MICTTCTMRLTCNVACCALNEHWHLNLNRARASSSYWIVGVHNEACRHDIALC